MTEKPPRSLATFLVSSEIVGSQWTRGFWFALLVAQKYPERWATWLEEWKTLMQLGDSLPQWTEAIALMIAQIDQVFGALDEAGV